MSLSFHYSQPCSICDKDVIDEDGMKSLRKRCINCQGVFFVCGNCSDAVCPKCKGILLSKKETFPDNLFAAIKNDDLDKAKYLCKDKVIEGVVDDNGNTLLINAAMKQQYEFCRFFIDDCGVSIVEKNKNGRTALMEMVRCRSKVPSKKLISLFKESANEQDNDGRTALMFAVIGAGLFGSTKGNIGFVKLLLEIGADLNIKDEMGSTALKWAEINNRKKSNNLDIRHYL